MHRRETFLANAGTSLLSSPLSVQETVERITQLVVPAIADWCCVDLPDENMLGVARLVDGKLSTSRGPRPLGDSRTAAPRGLERVLATGKPELHPEATEALLADYGRDREQLAVLRELGSRSMMVVPLLARGSTLGAITLVAGSERAAYTNEDLQMARRLAQKAALALENARLFRRELYARLASERAATRMSRLHALAADLEQAMTSEAVAQVLIEHSVVGVGAKSAAVWTLDDDRKCATLLRAMSYSSQLAASYAEVDLDGDDPVAVAARTCQPLFIDSFADYDQRFPASARRIRDQLVSDHVVAIACLPLVVRGEALGVLSVSFALEDQAILGADDRMFLTLGARHCALGLNRARMYEREQRARREMGLLYALVDATSRATSLDSIYELALDALQSAFGTTQAGVLLAEDDAGLCLKAWHGLSPELRVAIDACAGALSSSDAFTVRDVEQAATLAPLRDALREARVGSLATFPLLHHGRLLGTLLSCSSERRAFNEAELALARSVATQIAQAIVRRRSDLEIEALYREAQSARQEAEQANRMKDEFLAVVSHELRTPLAAILGWAQILEGERRNDPVTLAKGLQVIERNARAQSKIIEDILDVSRIVTGKLVLEPRKVALASVISDAVEAVRAAATAKDIALDLVGVSALPVVFGDSGRLRQVFWNLLSNAIKFTPRAGRVELRAEARDGAVIVSVTDDGAGIAPSFLPHVFERFRQADSSARRTHGGLGLGLAIVRHLVELHGGHVRVDSRGAGQGSTFTVELPVASPASAQAEAASAQPTLQVDPRTTRAVRTAARLDGVRVLVVEDEKDAREMLVESLRARGADVHAAANVRDAMAQVHAHAPQVLLSDIGMPEEDGIALMSRVRQLPSPARPAVAIALTAYARPVDQQRVLEAGYAAHLAKPAPIELIVSTMARLLRSAPTPE